MCKTLLNVTATLLAYQLHGLTFFLILIDWLMIAYIALFSALLSRLTALACGSTWVTSFFIAFFFFFFFLIHRSGVLTALAWLVAHETAAVWAQVLCTPYNHAPCHFMQSHICKVYACLAVTCHLHFWQNDRDLLRATAVTRGWNGYRNKGQHRNSTLEKKILPPLQQGFETATFQSWVWRSSHWAIPTCISHDPKGRPGISDVIRLSGISRLSFDSPLLFCAELIGVVLLLFLEGVITLFMVSVSIVPYLEFSSTSY